MKRFHFLTVIIIAALCLPTSAIAASIDDKIDSFVQPLTDLLSGFNLYGLYQSARLWPCA